jgi:hypothetical protein
MEESRGRGRGAHVNPNSIYERRHMKHENPNKPT